MATRDSTDFLAGVIEGFYGPPWSQAERVELFDWMAAWGLNTYLYAPKDDLKHRAIWRELYSTAEAEALLQLIRACEQCQIRFIYALSPGLDIRYGDEAELGHLQRRLAQMQGLGCRHFALLFDDIPEGLDAGTIERWGSLAAAQCHLANALFRWARGPSPNARFLFCPTPYCGRMAERKLGGEGYLPTIGRELSPEIDVFWTGPEIVSEEISVAHVQELEAILQRKPVIWDNLHANDYDGRRFYCGPYAGRPTELRQAVGGVLCNPNNEFPLNYVPLRTFAEFVRTAGTWKPRPAYLSALREWWPRFATVGQPVTLEDLILFGDCFYLPYEEGPEAKAFYECAQQVLSGNRPPTREAMAVFQQWTGRLRAFCARMTELRHRPLFNALYRRVWELREELDLLERYVRHQGEGQSAEASCRSDFHLLGTYRSGMLFRLQHLLTQESDGSFQHSHGKSEMEADVPTERPAALIP